MGDKVESGGGQDIQSYYKHLKADGRFSQKDLEKLAKKIMADGRIDEQDKQVLRDIATTLKLESYKLQPLPKEVQAQFDQIRANVTDPAVMARLKGNMQSAVAGSSATVNWQDNPIGPKELFPQLYGRASQGEGLGGVEALNVTSERQKHVLEVYAKVAAANGWTSPGQMKVHMYEIVFLSTVVDAMERSGAKPAPYIADGGIDKVAVRQHYDKHRDEKMPRLPGDTTVEGPGFSLKQLAHYYGTYAAAEEIRVTTWEKAGSSYVSWEATDRDDNYNTKHALSMWAETDPARIYHPIPNDPRTDTFRPHNVYIDETDGERDSLFHSGPSFPIEFPVKWK